MRYGATTFNTLNLQTRSHPAMESKVPCGSSDNGSQSPLAAEYNDRISTLPTHHGWKMLDLCEYQGFWTPVLFQPGIMRCQDHFQAQATDIFLSSAPKTGTTWLKALAFAILTRHRFDDSNSPLLAALPHDCVPFLEVDAAQDSFTRSPLPLRPLISTHLPYTSLPQSALSSHCKIVYICREPKDTFVSVLNFVRKFPTKEGEHPTLEKAFDMFCEGISPYGPYWDHVLGYWKASMECPERVLFLKYADLKSDTLYYLKLLAQFMGCPFSLEEETQGVVQKIMDLCSFEVLSNLAVNKTGKHRADSALPVENNWYFREGKVGDWKNHLTDEMVQRIDGITQHKFSGCGFMFPPP